MAPVRTRFAPSPTGYLHIGGVRTALFNWLLTRQQGGQFILRIDDTDVGRNRPEALQPILDGFRWLGLHWDEGPEVGGPHEPYYQSQRGHLYTAAALQLLESGHAYPCYTSKEQLDADRKAAEAAKRPFIYRGANRDLPAAECVRMYRDQPAPLRLKVPLGRTIAVDDLIRGRVEWQSDGIGDPVILRADGSPLYNFATVVDDAEMQITHVIRAAEHLDNTKIQVLIYEGLGQPLPKFAHIPLVNEPGSTKKLSKRNMAKFMTEDIKAVLRLVGWTDEQIATRDDLNPVTVAFYREIGYLPEGLINGLARLGWSQDDRTEFFTRADLIRCFSIAGINKSPASFDMEKLAWIAGEHMKRLPLAERVQGVLPFLRRAGLIGDPVDPATMARVEQIVSACAHRLNIYSDILLYAPPLLRREVQYDPKAVEKKLKKAGAPEVLRPFREVLAVAEPFEPAPLEQLLQRFCAEGGHHRNTLIHALRVAITGVEVGLGLYDSLAILGREEVLRRIDVALEMVK